MNHKKYIKFLKALLKVKPVYFIISIFLNVIIFSYAAGNTYCIRGIINTIETSIQGNGRIYSSIFPYLLALLILAFIRTTAIFLSGYIDNVREFTYRNLLRLNIIRLIYKKNNLKNIAGDSSKVFEVVDDDVPACSFPAEILSEVLGFIGYSSVAIGMLLTINPRVTIFIFIPLSISMLIINKVSEKVKGNRRINRKSNEEISGVIGDTVNSVMAIKVSHSECAVLNHYDSLNHKRMKVMLKDILFNSQLNMVLDGTIYLGTIIMMYIVANEMMNGTFSVGDFLMFTYYLDVLTDCVSRVIEMITDTKKGEVSYERIIAATNCDLKDELLFDTGLKLKKAMESYKDSGPLKNPLVELELRNVSCSYDGVNGIHNVNLKIKKGETVVITGGIGSGKSTLVNALLGIIPLDSGDILWNGEKITDLKGFFRVPNIAISSQNSRLFHNSIIENITFGKPIDQLTLYEALYDSVFDQDIKVMENGLQKEIGNRGEGISGGQKQRLSLTRLLYHKAELNILDNVTSGLDINTEDEFLERYEKRRLKYGFTSIIITDSQRVINKADRVLVLKNGYMEEYFNA